MDSPHAALDAQRIDWEAVEHSEPFQELVRKRGAFVRPATIGFLVWYLAFILLAGYAPGFMGESVYQGLTVGYCLALTQFVMVWGLGLIYLRKADNVYEPLEQKAVAHALATAPAAGANGNGRVTQFTGLEVGYLYDDKPETARIVVEGEHVLIYADADGLPARFVRRDLLAAVRD